MFDYKVDPAGLNNPKYPWYITNGVTNLLSHHVLLAALCPTYLTSMVLLTYTLQAAGHYDGLDVLQKPIPATVPYAQDTAYGWSRLTFHNCSALTHEFVASGNGSVLDTATLYKNRTCLSSGKSVPSSSAKASATVAPSSTTGAPWPHRPTETAWPGQGWGQGGGWGHPHGRPAGSGQQGSGSFGHPHGW
jgi:hypothetical protein